MIKSDEYRLILLVCCLLLLSVYSIKIQAQESESESTSQLETITESEQDSEGNSEDSTTETEEKPTFNVDVLVDRMKETKAIGVITKLSLKNQVDDLLEQADEIKSTNGEVAEEKSALRENFEGLILKTVTLLNKGKDYTLAEYIYLAREELWKSIMENKA